MRVFRVGLNRIFWMFVSCFVGFLLRRYNNWYNLLLFGLLYMTILRFLSFFISLSFIFFIFLVVSPHRFLFGKLGAFFHLIPKSINNPPYPPPLLAKTSSAMASGLLVRFELAASMVDEITGRCNGQGHRESEWMARNEFPEEFVIVDWLIVPKGPRRREEFDENTL